MKVLFPNISENIPRKTASVVWKDAGREDLRKVFEQFSVNKEYIGDVFVNISKSARIDRDFIIEVKNRLGKLLGSELMSMDKENGRKIFGFNIQVEKEYQRKRFRIGELLRSASIMEMLKNDSQHIKIYSKDTAVYFHSKYKFEPDITVFEERDRTLQDIITDNSPGFADLRESAQKLLEEAVLSKKDAPRQRDLCKRTNALVKQYLERALLDEKPEKTHPFTYGFSMILKKDTVLRFKDFFNKVFERQGIDYKI